MHRQPGFPKVPGSVPESTQDLFFNKMFLDQSVNNQLLPPSHAATSHKICSLALSCCVTFGKLITLSVPGLLYQ